MGTSPNGSRTIPIGSSGHMRRHYWNLADEPGRGGAIGRSGTAAIGATATVSFALLLAGLAAVPGKRRVDAAGIGFHSIMVPLIARLPAPAWTKMAGFGWSALDIALSVAALSGAAKDKVMPVRLGGHLLASAWIAGASQSMPSPLRWLGRTAAASLGGHTLVGGFTKKPWLLRASGPLQLLWLAGTALSLSRRGDAT